MTKLTHFSDSGDAHMVDIGEKDITERFAVAEGYLVAQAETIRLINSGEHKKGDVLGIARIAGIMGCKRTSDIIPLCHPVPLTHCSIHFELLADRVRCECRAETRDRTGIEMEALMGVQTALITIYDMCKAVDKTMTITDVSLLEKAGGRSGHFKK